MITRTRMHSIPAYIRSVIVCTVTVHDVICLHPEPAHRGFRTIVLFILDAEKREESNGVGSISMKYAEVIYSKCLVSSTRTYYSRDCIIRHMCIGLAYSIDRHLAIFLGEPCPHEQAPQPAR